MPLVSIIILIFDRYFRGRIGYEVKQRVKSQKRDQHEPVQGGSGGLY